MDFTIPLPNSCVPSFFRVVPSVALQEEREKPAQHFMECGVPTCRTAAASLGPSNQDENHQAASVVTSLQVRFSSPQVASLQAAASSCFLKT